MPPNIYTLDNYSFTSEAFQVHRRIENGLTRKVRSAQSTIWEHMGTPAQDLLIEGSVTLDDLKNIFPNGTALDKYGWTIPVNSVYIRAIPITPCEDETAQRLDDTKISEEDMSKSPMKDFLARAADALRSRPF